MSGRIIYEVHKCVQPRIEPAWNDGTQWRCDCGSVWEIVTSWGEQTWFTFAKAHWLKTNRQEMYKHNRRKCDLCLEGSRG